MSLIQYASNYLNRQNNIVVILPPTLIIPMIVFSGESNSGGQALNSQATPQELAPRQETKILNNTTFLFEDLDVGTNNAIDHFGLPTTTMHSWEIGIANIAATNAYTPIPFHLVKTGQGGSTISQWAVGSTYWTKMQQRLDAGISILGNQTIPFVLFYSHGINDGIAGTNTSTWQNDTIAHFTKIRAKYGQNIPIIMTKIMSTAPNYVGYNLAIENICNSLQKCYFVETNGLPQDDSYHWSYVGQKSLAQILFNKMLTVI